MARLAGVVAAGGGGIIYINRMAAQSVMVLFMAAALIAVAITVDGFGGPFIDCIRIFASGGCVVGGLFFMLSRPMEGVAGHEERSADAGQDEDREEKV